MTTKFWMQLWSVVKKLFKSGIRGLKGLGKGAENLCIEIADDPERDDLFSKMVGWLLLGTFIGAFLALVFGKELLFLGLLLLAVAQGYAVPKVVNSLIERQRFAASTKEQLKLRLLLPDN